MRPKQTLLLGLMLLVPVLAFLFLKTFGTNRYALPTYLPDRVDSTQVGGKWQRDTVFHRIVWPAVQSQSGRPVSSQDFAKGLYVVNFFYTTCAGACPQVSSLLQRVQEKFRHEPRVRLTSVTLDPAHDTPAILEKYAEQYGAISGKWLFLTGDKTAVYRLLTDEFRLPAPQGVAPGLQHSQQLFLVDRAGQVRGRYDGSSPKEIERLITEIGVMLYSYDLTDEPRR
ncbi:SCO family protein [Hymenobacter lutimineralis]|uniref:SCO family protein n=1 Tax=Hymenobacter lutimineralis TaxID=2606448 RepID=A0A5D6UZ41_9BACT|nr:MULTISPECIES: SCO family protein [Hymenobacter]QIX60671.1 SCO family protein [Hymenobacter sp. BT18]TYZ08686.1 SCO family protein [Hymenobacter lutimineralis]